MQARDYYAELEVGSDADEQAIKHAYCRLVRQQPGRGRALHEAYQTLSDPQKRQRYDAVRQHGQHRLPSTKSMNGTASPPQHLPPGPSGTPDAAGSGCFARRGDDLLVEAAVDIYTAAVGGAVRVPTLAGPVVLALPPQTQADHLFCLAGQGLPRQQQPAERGDLYIRVKLVLPGPLSEPELGALRELAQQRAANQHAPSQHVDHQQVLPDPGEKETRGG